MKNFILIVLLVLVSCASDAQLRLSGVVLSDGKPMEFASVMVLNKQVSATTDSTGYFSIKDLPAGKYFVKVSSIGYVSITKEVLIDSLKSTSVDFFLKPNQGTLNEVVVTGTLKEVNRLESPVPVEVFTATFFKKNPTPSIFDALQNVNGVKPQLNCNVCNTGDIHINGLEGPYTMIMIDGMPIVSGLSSVYGLSGIPNSLIERVEIIKGPASSLYGSEAVGGLINIITKKPQNAPLLSADFFGTSWNEYNTDLGFKFNVSKKASILSGINYYKYGNIKDYNHDNFTDVTLQDRISLFQKWNFTRKDNRLFSIAGRYNYEDRWGGDISWTKSYRGGSEKYAESIYTKRWELIGNYQLPVKEKFMLSFSFNDHNQNSVYGSTIFNAKQTIGFSQLTWDKTIKKHDLLAGTALRLTYYNDNTPATINPGVVSLPGIFVQDEISLVKRHKVLFGLRYDYNSVHGNILTPRFAYKWTISDNNILRLNAGSGYRVVSVFTEDHAALTGARDVIITEELKPEKSFNVNLNYIKKIYLSNGSFIGLDASSWVTHFNNRIMPDYVTDPNKIIYKNLNGFAISRGFSSNVDVALANGFKVLLGVTLLDVYTKNKLADGSKVKTRPFFTERWSGTWALSYKIDMLHLAIDYTGNLYGSANLPKLGNLDPRSGTSPVWSIQNIQLTFSGNKKYEIYGGVKNLLNWTPAKRAPFIIANSNDPFDKNVVYDNNGQVIPTEKNPYALTFDPSSVYAPNQGIRGFLGVRMNIR